MQEGSTVTESNKFDHAVVEPKWQRYWEEHSTFAAKRRPGKDKKYVLDMFPYPSGSGLHVGHPEGYTASDVMARYWRMCDFDVLHPMGWDSFGLPAEQHAINTGTHPAATTKKNIGTFKRQLKSLGFSFDWKRELATTDEEYVRWTQWIFLQLFKRGLAFQNKVPVNWCPQLGTVLSNEEVINGKSERGEFPVVRTPLRQWVLKITAYADRLLEDLQGLQWPEGTMTAQKGWIGRSEGAEIDFSMDGSEAVFNVFTTRPDTLMGVTYVVLAPEHPLVEQITTSEQQNVVARYIGVAASKSDLDRVAQVKDKSGVSTGAFALHPLTSELVPIWISDYVLGGYGSGAVMAVPAHDQRDFEFAAKFGLPVKQVVSPDGKVSDQMVEAFTGSGVNVQSSSLLDGLETDDAQAKVISELIELGKGRAKVTYKLRDWAFSRQRYWGEPFPIYFPVDLEDPTADPRTGAKHTIRYEEPIPVEEADLPVKLPELADFKPGDNPEGCLARATNWRYFQQDGKWFARETNTMPQWAGSCWYYLRFCDPSNFNDPIGKTAYQSWMPVDLYVGGAEHAVLHLLYARFWHKVLFDLGVVTHKEPFQKLVHQGMILGEDGEKMSKSRGNVVNPDEIVSMYGADAMRLYEMFMGPLEAVKPWSTEQISGVVRFSNRVWALRERLHEEPAKGETLRWMHKSIKKVTQDYDSMSFNTAISQLMQFTNHLYTLDTVPKEALESLVLLVSPLAPHLGEEMWQQLGHESSLAYHPWPVYDDKLCVEDTVTIGIQVNGKVRGELTLVTDSKAEAVQQDAEKIVGKWVEGKELKKFIYVTGKIINFVVKD